MYSAECMSVLVDNDVPIALLPTSPVPEQNDSIITQEEVLSLLLTAAWKGTGSLREKCPYERLSSPGKLFKTPRAQRSTLIEVVLSQLRGLLGSQ